MTIKKTTLVATLCILAFSSPAFSDSDYSETLVDLVSQHRSGARDAEHELRIVENLEEIAGKSSDDWLAHYWAAYFLTQIVMSHPESRLARLDRAQSLLDQAKARTTIDEKSHRSDIFSLQALVYQFRASATKDEKQSQELKTLSDEARKEAFALDPKSPVAMVMAGTDLIREGHENGAWVHVMAGYALLLEAQALFSAAGQPRGLTTHFNSEWVIPWKDWVERMHVNGIDAE